VELTKRFSHGLDLTASYTWQKSLALGSGSSAGGANGGGINDVLNRENQKSLSDDYRPMILVIGSTYRTPGLKLNKVVNAVTSNWTTAGILNYRSGSLINVPSSVSSNMAAYTFQGTRMSRIAGQPVFNLDPGCGCIDPNKNTQVLTPPHGRMYRRDNGDSRLPATATIVGSAGGRAD
jgi:hypothetical protein